MLMTWRGWRQPSRVRLRHARHRSDRTDFSRSQRDAGNRVPPRSTEADQSKNSPPPRQEKARWNASGSIPDANGSACREGRENAGPARIDFVVRKAAAAGHAAFTASFPKRLGTSMSTSRVETVRAIHLDLHAPSPSRGRVGRACTIYDRLRRRGAPSSVPDLWRTGGPLHWAVQLRCGGDRQHQGCQRRGWQRLRRPWRLAYLSRSPGTMFAIWYLINNEPSDADCIKTK
jgi:hypothetical protein